MQSDELLGLLHIYTGNGKGKTTAAIGLAVRMCGAGHRVLFAQFLKGRPSAELEPLHRLDIEVCRTGSSEKFTWEMTEPERIQCRESCQQVWETAYAALISGNYGLVVLDEVLDALAAGMLEERALQAALLQRSAATEVVLTGHHPSEGLCRMADYLSCIEAQKHPYQRGISARSGVEY